MQAPTLHVHSCRLSSQPLMHPFSTLFNRLPTDNGHPPAAFFDPPVAINCLEGSHAGCERTAVSWELTDNGWVLSHVCWGLHPTFFGKDNSKKKKETGFHQRKNVAVTWSLRHWVHWLPFNRSRVQRPRLPSQHHGSSYTRYVIRVPPLLEGDGSAIMQLGC